MGQAVISFGCLVSHTLAYKETGNKRLSDVTPCEAVERVVSTRSPKLSLIVSKPFKRGLEYP